MLRASALFVALLAALAVATVAFAHAEPATVSPGDGAVLNSSPATIVIEMSQEMTRREGANDIDVLDANGTEVTTVAAAVDNDDRKKLSVPLPADLPAGKYVVNWKTVSADDGDSANGQLSFTIDPSATPNAGTTNVRPDILGSSPTAAASGSAGASAPAAASSSSSGDGTSWVLVTAVGVGMFVVGSGGTFLLVRRPK